MRATRSRPRRHTSPRSSPAGGYVERAYLSREDLSSPAKRIVSCAFVRSRRWRRARSRRSRSTTRRLRSTTSTGRSTSPTTNAPTRRRASPRPTFPTPTPRPSRRSNCYRRFLSRLLRPLKKYCTGTSRIQRKLIKRASRYAVGGPFVFLQLLERDAERGGQAWSGSGPLPAARRRNREATWRSMALGRRSDINSTDQALTNNPLTNNRREKGPAVCRAAIETLCAIGMPIPCTKRP